MNGILKSILNHTRAREMVMVIALVILPAVHVQAQEATPISAANIDDLRSIQQIDFDTERFNSGWFVIDSTGERIMALDRHNQAYVWTDQGTLIASLPIENGNQAGLVFDAVFLPENQLAILVDGRAIQLWNLDDESIAASIDVPSDITQQTLWHSEDQLWGEALSTENEPIIVQYDMTNNTDPIIKPYAPATDPEAVVRIGRIRPPYAITSSLDGLITLWGMEKTESINTADNQLGIPAVFGAIDPEASAFAWRDQNNETLYLLDFETDENLVVADLAGAYVHWFLLPASKDTIIAVHKGSEAGLFAWKIGSAEAIELGPYRSCERAQPDMVRISADSTTIAIGCDTGIDLWRISTEED